MGNKFEVEVNESQEELKHRLHYAVTASSKERLQMLYWLKQDAITLRVPRRDRQQKRTISKIGRSMNRQYIDG
ncbi:hypothetical protein [Pleurocapsa sp. FMAR1]|uniref:hypothetical protein n=1 Tax=Pleurocapsa sp. FMAR1 TaxID=3040204 RepID=UPI0029C7BA1E|nr:hypothetical protein [Pleurocapsa sp. FMAR1]